jgi:hypothetical protein
MSRSGYTDDCDDNWQFIMYRGAVTSAINGRRGQAFLKEMLAALDALPEKVLIAEELEDDIYTGQVCALGAVGKARGLNMERIDPHDPETVASVFAISKALASEVAYMNDDWFNNNSPASRFIQMREWIKSQIKE